MICAEDINKRFVDKDGCAVKALDGVSITLEKGELVVVVGPSGCGKSTLLRCLSGLELIDSGRVSVGGLDVTNYPPERRNIEWLPQRISATFFPQKPLRYNMELGGRIKGTPQKEFEKRLRLAAQLVGIEELLERTPDAVSGGELQRAAIARALMSDSQVMLFDEPMVSLDEIRRATLLRELRAINQKLDRAILYVTHDQQEALSLGTRCVVMKNGRIEQDATPHDVYFRPANLFVARFFSPYGLNEITGHLDWSRGTPFVVIEGTQIMLRGLSHLPPNVKQEVIVGIRPEAMHIVPPGGSDSLVCLGEAEIVDSQFMGRETLIHFHMPANGQCLFASSHCFDSRSGESRAWLSISADDVFLFSRDTGENLQC